MGKRLEKVREWLTPRRRIWAGVGLLAAFFLIPAVSSGTTVDWLIGPAAVFLIGGLMPEASRRQ